MSWSSDFEDKLSGSGSFEPIIVLHVLSWTGTPGSEFYASSAPGYGFPEIIGPVLTMNGTTVSPVTWEYTHGTASLEIITDDIGGFNMSALRGSICEILIGFAGWDISEFQPVFVGRIQNIRGAKPNYVLELWDGTSILDSRLNVGSFTSFKENRNNLFYNVESTNYTELQSNYTTSSTAIIVTDHSDLEIASDGASYPGLIYVTPSGADPFFLTYTSKAGSVVLNGVTTSDILGTTRSAASIGTKVYNAAYLDGNPSSLFMRILTSGSGTGTYDVYPDSFGFGIPSSVIDTADVFASYYYLVSNAGSGSYNMQYGQKDSVSDSWTWFKDFFKSIGVVPVQRHGRLTFRLIQDPNNAIVESGVQITDQDISEVVEWGAYQPDVPAEYQQVRVVGTGLSTSTSIRYPETSPMADRLTYDNTEKFFQYVSTNIAEIKTRVGPWGPNLPEYVVLRCAGLRLATLCPLDVVRVTCPAIGKGRIKATREEGYVNQPCTVLSVSPDFYSGSVEITLAAIDSL